MQPRFWFDPLICEVMCEMDGTDGGVEQFSVNKMIQRAMTRAIQNCMNEDQLRDLTGPRPTWSP